MTSPGAVPQIDPTQARDRAADGALLLDVREPQEWAAGHVEGATHVPLGELDPAKFAGGRAVVAICRSGRRSDRAAAALAAAGVDAVNMAGGMQAWAQAGLPVVDDDGRPGTVA